MWVERASGLGVEGSGNTHSGGSQDLGVRVSLCLLLGGPGWEFSGPVAMDPDPSLSLASCSAAGLSSIPGPPGPQAPRP